MLQIKKEEMFLFILALIVFIIAVLIIKSFIIPLLFSMILVYILNPLYTRIRSILRFHSLTAFVVITLFLTISLAPIIYTSIQMSKQINSFETGVVDQKLLLINDKIKDKFAISLALDESYHSFIDNFRTYLESFVYKLPQILFNIFIIVFFYYYFSRDYSHERTFIKSLFEKRFNSIEAKFKDLVNAIVYGQIFVRFLQALIGTIGFILIGVKGAFFWGPMLFFVAFIPVLGTGLIWGPLAVFTFITEGDIILSILVLVVGIIISFIDNLLLPYVISTKTKMGPVIVLISIIGGISFFGLYGILLGPLFLGVTYLIIDEIFDELRKRNPRVRKFIWTEDERKKFKSLKSDIARQEFIRMLNNKYEKIHTETSPLKPLEFYT